MADWLWGIGLTASFLMSYRVCYHLVDAACRKEFGGNDDAGDRAFTAFMSMMASFIWPALLLGWLVYRVATPTTKGQRVVKVAEREEDVARREREIARLEREAGIR